MTCFFSIARGQKIPIFSAAGLPHNDVSYQNEDVSLMFLLFNSHKWLAVNFSLQYQYIAQQWGDENIQIYQPEDVILM